MRTRALPVLSQDRRSIVAALLLAIGAAWFAALPAPATAAGVPGATPTVATDAALRDLWLGHAFWVRNVVQETLAHNKAGAAAAEGQVVANAKQIAAAIEPFYGKPAADKLFTLLAGHYGAIKDYLMATDQGSKARQATAKQHLIDNATEIARFLSSANPNLPFDALQGLLMAHGGHHLQQIEQFKARQYADEAQTWLAMKDHLYGIADALTVALATQFSDKFAAR